MRFIKALMFSAILLSCPSKMMAEVFKAENYTETEISKLKAIPEEYKNKKVCYESTYRGYETTFPQYVEKSGFKAGKDYYLMIRPMVLPVMAGKSKEMNELIPTLKKDSKVKVYGKIKKFMSEPERTFFPRYYLDLDKIEVVEDAANVKKEDRKTGDKADQEEEDGNPWRLIGLPPNLLKR